MVGVTSTCSLSKLYFGDVLYKGAVDKNGDTILFGGSRLDLISLSIVLAVGTFSM